ARACERLPVDTLLDGEIVAIDKSGRISFNLLQHHRSHAQALLFFAFDVIVFRGKSLVNTPLEKRRTVLNDYSRILVVKRSRVRPPVAVVNCEIALLWKCRRAHTEQNRGE